jgi:O-acetyl-ADP-ribose deacetylase (regulator of RNase III)
VDIIYKTGDLTQATEPYIIHGCNAQGKMGSGVAKALMDRYPAVKEHYLENHAKHAEAGKRFLGTMHIGHTDTKRVIYNLITQEFYGYDGKLYASYEAIEQCMRALDNSMRCIKEAKGTTPHVAMPLLGCGLAGGDWSVVSEIVQKCSKHFQPVVYTLDGVVPGVTDTL